MTSGKANYRCWSRISTGIIKKWHWDVIHTHAHSILHIDKTSLHNRAGRVEDWILQMHIANTEAAVFPCAATHRNNCGVVPQSDACAQAFCLYTINNNVAHVWPVDVATDTNSGGHSLGVVCHHIFDRYPPASLDQLNTSIGPHLESDRGQSAGIKAGEVADCWIPCALNNRAVTVNRIYWRKTINDNTLWRCLNYAIVTDILKWITRCNK